MTFDFPVFRFVRWVAPWLAMFAVSCASKPTMQLNHAEISGVDVATSSAGFGLLMTVFLDVHNPNSFDLAVRAMRGQVVMAGKSIPVDFRPPGEGIWLPSAKTTSVRVPIHLPMDLVLALLRETVAAPSIDFHLTGRADVIASRALRFKGDDYSMDERGSISRAQVAAIIPSSLAPSP